MFTPKKYTANGAQIMAMEKAISLAITSLWRSQVSQKRNNWNSERVVVRRYRG